MWGENCFTTTEWSFRSKVFKNFRFESILLIPHKCRRPIRILPANINWNSPASTSGIVWPTTIRFAPNQSKVSCSWSQISCGGYTNTIVSTCENFHFLLWFYHAKKLNFLLCFLMLTSLMGPTEFTASLVEISLLHSGLLFLRKNTSRDFLKGEIHTHCNC